MAEMKFFSDEWRHLENGAEQEAVNLRYLALLETFEMPMRDKVGHFVRTYNLNDSYIDKIWSNSAKQIIGINFIQGCNATGYRNLRVRYLGARFEGTDRTVLERAATIRNVEVLYDEFDLRREYGGEVYFHRFSIIRGAEPLGIIAIRFSDLLVEPVSLSGRHYVTYGDTLDLQ